MPPASGTGDHVSQSLKGAGTDPANGKSPQAPSSPSRATPLALGALIVCVGAFVLGLVPLAGAVLGIAGIVLAVLAARRGQATRRTYVAAVAAAVATLASVATTIALIGLVAFSGGEGDPAPVAASERSSTSAEQDEAPTSEAPTSEAPPPVPTASARPPVTAEPTTEPTPEQDAAPDLSAYEELDERTLAQIVKAPDDHLGRQVILYGAITQLDSATEKCTVRISVSN